MTASRSPRPIILFMKSMHYIINLFQISLKARALHAYKKSCPHIKDNIHILMSQYWNIKKTANMVIKAAPVHTRRQSRLPTYGWYVKSGSRVPDRSYACSSRHGCGSPCTGNPSQDIRLTLPNPFHGSHNSQASGCRPYIWVMNCRRLM